MAVTCEELWRAAVRWARLFEARGLRSGDAVVLFAHPVPGFVSALLGAQAAGLLAVPCPPPEPLESARRVRQRVTEILARCDARVLLNPVLVPPDPEFHSMLAQIGSVLLTPEDLEVILDTGEDVERTERLSVAYCQFTSGSGGRAKGVLVTHEGLAANVRAMTEAFAFTRRDVFVTWLPLFHDMGLVAYVFMPLILGCPTHLMSPQMFITRPGSWLELITAVRATVSAAPNFAYALCARRVSAEERRPLDLSSWRVATNGSEPVTRAAVEAFIERFSSCGFQASAMLPCYGLAENTLCATTRRPGEGTRFEEVSRGALEDGVAQPQVAGRTLASVGRVLGGHQIAILGADGGAVGERRVGEVAIHGPSVMQGYLASTEGEVPLTPDGWLYTGDLGYRAEGELFLVGRKKDLIIHAGRNYYPEDLEEAVAAVAGVRPGRAVAFSVPGEASELVVLAAEQREEYTGDAGALRRAIRDAVFAAVGLTLDKVLLLSRNDLPLTSSGKVMRPEARRLYLQGRWSGG